MAKPGVNWKYWYSEMYTRLGAYPLQHTAEICLHTGSNKEILASPSGKGWTTLPALEGYGHSVDDAIAAFNVQFAALVARLRVPPNLQKEEDKLFLTNLNLLIDWKRYDEESPKVRLLWGKLLSYDEAGATVRWLLGPHDEQHVTKSIIAAGSVAGSELVGALAVIPLDAWFMAVVRKYPTSLIWFERPYVVPEPATEKALKAEQAWALVPIASAPEEAKRAAVELPHTTKPRLYEFPDGSYIKEFGHDKRWHVCLWTPISFLDESFATPEEAALALYKALDARKQA